MKNNKSSKKFSNKNHFLTSTKFKKSMAMNKNHKYLSFLNYIT